MIDSDKTFDKFLSECLAAPSLCSIANATGPGTTVDSLKSAIGEAFEELYKSQRTMIGAIGALTYQSGMVPALLYDHIKRDVWQRLYMPQRYAGAADMLALLLARNFSIYETPPASTAPAEHAELPYNEGRLSFWGITCSDTSFRTSKIKICSRVSGSSKLQLLSPTSTHRSFGRVHAGSLSPPRDSMARSKGQPRRRSCS